MKNTKKGNKEITFRIGNKKIVLFKNIAEIIFCSIILICCITYFLSPKAVVICTGRYNSSSGKDNNIVEEIFGREDAKERYELYFQWFNVIHELGHGIIRATDMKNMKGAEEEQLVNDFAVAYWRYYGEKEKFEEFESIVNYACNYLKNPTNEELTYMEYGKKYWGKSDFYNFKNYGYFQFNSNKSSLQNNKTLEQVLKEMGVEEFEITEQVTLEYPEITEEVSRKIVQDAVLKFREWGINYPEVYQKFDDNPNNNYSMYRRNVLGIYGLLYN